MNAEILAGKIDHTLLKAFAQKEEIQQLCNEAIKFKFASVCVPPYYLDLVDEMIGQDPDVLSCTVIGFPLGYETTEMKKQNVLTAISHKADEIDVVINVAAIKNGDWDYVKNELVELRMVCSQNDKILKIIFETCYLENKEIAKLAQLCAETGVDFVKTSTGFGAGGARVEHLELMRENVKGKCKIKASGGIRTLEDAKKMIDAGADRIGASAGVAIVEALRD
mgnify:CR=1 FL=1|jgi:deoxyribose-phosphate aldolase